MIRENGSLYLSQPGKIAKLVETAGLPTTAHTYQNPMRETFSDDDQDKSPQCDHTLYKSLLGGLIFVLRSRPDIAYAVNRLATRSTKATEKDMEALKRVVAYLRCTAHYELVLSAQNPAQRQAVARLYAWSDASYLQHCDSKSHTGTCFFYGDGPTGAMHSQSKKQSTVATSSTHAEINGAYTATLDIIHFRHLLQELGYSQIEPTPLMVDNQSLITLCTKFSGSTKAVKHIMMRINFMIG
jgi:hypothetical protein